MFSILCCAVSYFSMACGFLLTNNLNLISCCMQCNTDLLYICINKLYIFVLLDLVVESLRSDIVYVDGECRVHEHPVEFSGKRSG